MSLRYIILDDRPERFVSLRFMLQLRGLQVLQAMDAAEVLNWQSACRQSETLLGGVVVYAEPTNVKHLLALSEAGFEPPVYALLSNRSSHVPETLPLNLFVGSMDEVLHRIARVKGSRNDREVLSDAI